MKKLIVVAMLFLANSVFANTLICQNPSKTGTVVLKQAHRNQFQMSVFEGNKQILSSSLKLQVVRDLLSEKTNEFYKTQAQKPNLDAIQGLSHKDQGDSTAQIYVRSGGNFTRYRATAVVKFSNRMISENVQHRLFNGELVCNLSLRQLTDIVKTN